MWKCLLRLEFSRVALVRLTSFCGIPVHLRSSYIVTNIKGEHSVTHCILYYYCVYYYFAAVVHSYVMLSHPATTGTGVLWKVMRSSTAKEHADLFTSWMCADRV